MEKTLRKRTDRDVIEAISSKSYVHRLLIAAALCRELCTGRPMKIKSNIVSMDMIATMEALNALGAKIRRTQDGFELTRGISYTLEEVSFSCGESGSTARFLLPLAVSCCDSVSMSGEGRLPERTNEALVKAMEPNGVSADSYFLPIRTEGRLKSGRFVLPGNVSSQYITGLMLTLPSLDGDSDIVITTKLESEGYLDITMQVLEQFGVVIEKTEDGYHVPGGQKYAYRECITAEGDWSNGAYVLGMGAVCGQMSVIGLNPESVQGDRAFERIAEQFGAQVSRTISSDGETVITVKRGDMKGIEELDVSGIPDLVPALAVIAFFCEEGNTRFSHVERLRIKESDRVEAVICLIRAIGGNAFSEKTDGGEDLIIVPSKAVSDNVEVDSFKDHRIVMAAAMAKCGMSGEMVIRDAEAINKSYPGYFEELEWN